ncbi:triose-phosphate isomerase [Propionibacteriaceae bacterium Y2011]|uniref:triose-phosphate isomerase n=1 Tax=Microlunatus sp. Y2014 TaxID=3418488 RepID=UPI003B4AC103
MAGNWKMNLNHMEAVGFVQKLAWTLQDKKYDPQSCEVVVIPPFTDLRGVQSLITSDRLPLGWGAQDVSAHESGAYTGEVSAAMLAKLECRYVLVGHSERRQYHAEDDALVSAKVGRVLGAGMSPIICVGEDLEVRQAGNQIQHTLTQLDGALAGLTAEQVAECVIAYEPVWAIGTGEVATPEDAQEVCGAIRARIAETHDADGGSTADVVRVLYGGSVKPGNVAQIMAQADVDGALVGGASLVVDDFAAIARFAELPAL